VKSHTQKGMEIRRTAIRCAPIRIKINIPGTLNLGVNESANKLIRHLVGADTKAGAAGKRQTLLTSPIHSSPPPPSHHHIILTLSPSPPKVEQEA
jgi:hypothetical protein